MKPSDKQQQVTVTKINIKQHTCLLLIFACVLFFPSQRIQAGDTLSVLRKRLEETPLVASVKPLESTEFTEKYELFIFQPLDHSQPGNGTFTQRIVLSHVGFDRPTLLITEGYGASYALHPSYREELSRLFNMNMIFVEHRYFLESTPHAPDMAYLTAENSAHDLHQINTLFREFYSKGKWVSTGVSKGGQTTLFYRTYFPADVDFSVPYVAPLNRSVEDGRHERFLESEVGTPEQRRRLLNFQLELCKRKEALLPAFSRYCETQKIHFRRPAAEIFDFCILEYPFAFWQWGTPSDQIPALDAPNQALLDHLVGLSKPSYFSDQGPHLSFNVQALRELGYYGYDLKPFKEWFTIKTTKNYLRELMVPEALEYIKFSKTLYNKTHNYLLKNDPKILFIYGEYDPWTVSGVIDPVYFKDKKNMQLYIQPGGSHRARIGNMPEEMKEQILTQVRLWLEE